MTLRLLASCFVFSLPSSRSQYYKNLPRLTRRTQTIGSLGEWIAEEEARAGSAELRGILQELYDAGVADGGVPMATIRPALSGYDNSGNWIAKAEKVCYSLYTRPTYTGPWRVGVSDANLPASSFCDRPLALASVLIAA